MCVESGLEFFRPRKFSVPLNFEMQYVPMFEKNVIRSRG